MNKIVRLGVVSAAVSACILAGQSSAGADVVPAVPALPALPALPVLPATPALPALPATPALPALPFCAMLPPLPALPAAPSASAVPVLGGLIDALVGIATGTAYGSAGATVAVVKVVVCGAG
jgi:hypothetical protein